MFVIEIISRFKQEKMLTRQSVALVLQAACSCVSSALPAMLHLLLYCQIWLVTSRSCGVTVFQDWMQITRGRVRSRTLTLFIKDDRLIREKGTFLFSGMQTVTDHSYLTEGSGWGVRVVVVPVWTAPRPVWHFLASSTGSILLWCWRAMCSPVPPGQGAGQRKWGRMWG